MDAGSIPATSTSVPSGPCPQKRGQGPLVICAGKSLCLHLYICRIGGMQPLSRVTPATLDVLEVLVAYGSNTVWGLEVVKRAGRPTGSVYPILDRLEQAGWLTS